MLWLQLWLWPFTVTFSWVFMPIGFGFLRPSYKSLPIWACILTLVVNYLGLGIFPPNQTSHSLEPGMVASSQKCNHPNPLQGSVYAQWMSHTSKNIPPAFFREMLNKAKHCQHLLFQLGLQCNENALEKSLVIRPLCLFSNSRVKFSLKSLLNPKISVRPKSSFPSVLKCA